MSGQDIAFSILFVSGGSLVALLGMITVTVLGDILRDRKAAAQRALALAVAEEARLAIPDYIRSYIITRAMTGSPTRTVYYECAECGGQGVAFNIEDMVEHVKAMHEPGPRCSYGERHSEEECQAQDPEQRTNEAAMALIMSDRAYEEPIHGPPW